jgi:acyl carrier protein
MLDAYHNDTPWGQARPSVRAVGAAELTAALAPTAVDVLWLDPVPLPPAPPATAEPVDAAAVEAYLRPYRQAAGGLEQLAALSQLTLETWLLQRSRRLHAGYLVGAGTRGEADLTGHLAGWTRVTEQVYLALRRAQRGREVPAGVLDRIAEALVADGPAFGAAPIAPAATGGTRARTADPNWPAFADVVAGVLDLPAGQLSGLASLADAPDCSSLRVVEIVERLESRFDLRFTGDELLPEHLYDIDFLLTAVARGAAQ